MLSCAFAAQCTIGGKLRAGRQVCIIVEETDVSSAIKILPARSFLKLNFSSILKWF